MEVRGIDPVLIRYPGDKVLDAVMRPPRGIAAFGDLIRTLQTSSSSPRFGTVTRLLAVADSDDAPTQNFELVVEQLRKRFPNHTMPTEPGQRVVGNPALQVMMLPLVGAGSIEGCCVAAANSMNAQVAAAVETFLGTLPPQRRTPIQNSDKNLGKFRITASVAALSSDPTLWFGRAVLEANLIPLNHSSFDGIADVLRDFAS